MKKTVLVLLSLFIFVGSTFAQEDDVKGFVDDKKAFKSDSFGWKKGGFFGLNGTSVGLTNWAAGGQEAISIGALADVFAIYSKGKKTWENYGKFGYGAIKLDGQKDFVKNEDNVDILSKYGYRIAPKWNVAGLVQLQTQMFRSFDPENPGSTSHISNIFAPAFGLTSIGLDYKPKPHLSLYISPITGKFTIVGDERLSNAGAFGVDPGETLRTEIGWYFKAMFQKDIMQNINLQSRLDLFDNYKTLDKIDVSWENTLNMKVNKYISASIFLHTKYDHDIDVTPDDATDLTTIGVQRAIQFKNVIGIGLAYKIGDSL